VTTAAYIGNVGPDSAPHSTENHIARALEANGVMVRPVHEQRFAWSEQLIGDDVDLVLWTHTHGFAPEKTHGAQRRFLDSMRARGIPTVGVHLDRWWDLNREHQIREEPFFRCDLVATADGGNQERFEAEGINHVWFPPGVSQAECVPGTYRAHLASEMAFVGSWAGGYHRESGHRYELVQWLKDIYGERCRFWPEMGQPAVRGEPLRDLYASVKVLVGDSCLVGTGLNEKYLSDRVPETIGRSGLLVHPYVDGVTDGTLYESGQHLLTWTAGDWDELRYQIDRGIHEDLGWVSRAGRKHVLATATYEVRMRDLLADLAERGLIKQEAAA
jgi:hypothetical protein